jgi:hypothetical protein
VDPGHYWDLEKALPGVRTASRSWQDHQALGYGEMGFDRCPMEPCGYWKADVKVKMETHGDDAMIIGKPGDVKAIAKEYTGSFTTKDPVFIGLGTEYEQEGSFLKRRFGVTQKGWYYEADPKHSRRLSFLDWRARMPRERLHQEIGL